MTEHDRPSEQDPAMSHHSARIRPEPPVDGPAVDPWAPPSSSSGRPGGPPPAGPGGAAPTVAGPGTAGWPAGHVPAAPSFRAAPHEPGTSRTDGIGQEQIEAWAPPGYQPDQPRPGHPLPNGAPWGPAPQQHGWPGQAPPGYGAPGVVAPITGFGQPLPPGHPQGMPPTGWVAPVEERPDPGTWTFLDVLAGLGLVLLLSSLLTWPFLVWTGAPQALVLVVAGFLPIWVGMLGVSWWAVRTRGTRSWRDDLGLRFKPVDLAIGLGVGLGCRLAAGVLVAILTAIQGGMGEGNLQVVTGGGELSEAALWFVMIGAVTFIAPVVEEIFFRGLLLRSIGSTMVRTRPAWTAARRRQVASLVSAGLFTAVHLTELTDPLSVLPLVITWFGLGYVTAQLTLKTGRLGPAIISHIVFNGVAAVALLSM